jgi:succinyl-CoA synthetase beta subunit
LLEQAGVPVVPARLARSVDEAVIAADQLGYPVVLKICGAGIAHKSDTGGVALGLSSEAAVRDAYARIVRQAEAFEVDGVLVAAMRSGGHELLAGVTIDPTFGPVLAVGLGGIWIEMLGDVVLRVLPIDRADARDMLGELKAARVLQGARGGASVDLDRVAQVLLQITKAASMVGPRLQALEINPLWCRGEKVEALDVLVVTETGEA